MLTGKPSIQRMNAHSSCWYLEQCLAHGQMFSKYLLNDIQVYIIQMIAQSEGKINVFILCCKNTVNWKREIRPISSYAGHLFHHEKYTIAFCTSVTDVLA